MKRAIVNCGLNNALFKIVLCVFFSGIIVVTASAVIAPTSREMAEQNLWVQQNLLTASNLPPFSFTYSGLSSAQWLKAWQRTETDTVLDTNRTQHVITWGDNVTQVKCVAIQYNDYPEVEWTVYIRNIGVNNSPIISGLQGLSFSFSRTNNGPEFVLNGNQGDSASAQSYEPFQTTLGPSTVNSFSPPSYSGRSSDATGWPYYNLQMPGGGVIMAIGWPGQWASSFTRDSGTNLQVQAGQQTTDFYLQPGEQVRTPLISMLFWQGTNAVRSQNIWRHFYLAHIIPLVNGQPPATVLQVQGDSSNVVNSYIAAGVHPNVLWRDAGSGPNTTWYPSSQRPYSGNNTWLNTGTWVVDTNAYPSGFGATSAQINALGVKFLLWFEPERVGNTNSSYLATQHPSWLLPATSSTVGAILNEGNTNVYNWLTNHIECLIQSNGLNWYREDMNGNGPLSAWQENDAANRQGITENFYVQGHLAYWDALLAMNPGLRIDCCGSGGRRLDMEAMRRAVPLTRTDYLTGDVASVPDGNQCQTYGLSFWLPFQGAGSYFNDAYSFRSFYMASFGMIYPANEVQAYTECTKVGLIMLNGDYYPLTPYSLNNNVWMAWQFDRAQNGDGCVQIFRRTNSIVPSMTFQLQGLVPGKLYDVQNVDTGDLGNFTGGELMSTGLTIQLSPRQSAILYYTNVQAISLSATGNPLLGPGPLTVQFGASGTSISGAPLTYAWAFGDGSVSMSQNPSYTYKTPGEYEAQVTATDGQGNTNTAEIPVTVLAPIGWQMQTTFSGYSSAQALTNFPVLITLGTNLSANGFSYRQMASSNGWDLVFMNSNQTQQLNYEIEKWNPKGNSYVWVQVPLLTSNTEIWAHWGDTNLASAPELCTTNGSVWANGYAGVWHLANGVVLSGADSTANSNNGTINNVEPTNGVVDGAAEFDGVNSSMSIGEVTNLMVNQQVTMSAWEYPLGGTVVMMQGNDDASQSFGLEWSGNASFLFTFGNTPDWLGDGGKSPPGQWSYVTGVINGNGKYLYINGILVASNTISGTLSTTTGLPFWFGAQDRPSFNYWYNGTLDEMRISSVARTPNWIWAEYMSMASNAVFNAYSPVTVFGSSTPISLTISLSGSNAIISWPANIAGNAVLQASTNLVDWTDSSAPVVVIGTNDTVSIGLEATANFYRLSY